MYQKIECFIAEESVHEPGKWRIVPRHDNFHIDGLPNGGSCNVICARLMGLSYAQYLRFCRDVLGAEIYGKGSLYPIAYFRKNALLMKFLRLLNNRANIVLWEREHPDWKERTDYVTQKEKQSQIERGEFANVSND